MPLLPVYGLLRYTRPSSGPPGPPSPKGEGKDLSPRYRSRPCIRRWFLAVCSPMPEHPRLPPAQRRKLFQLGAALCQTKTVGGQRAYRLADHIAPACAVRLVGAEHDVSRVGFLDIGGEGGIDIRVAAALVKIGCAEEVQDLVGKGGRGLRLDIGVGLGFLRNAVLKVTGRCVIG